MPAAAALTQWCSAWRGMGEGEGERPSGRMSSDALVAAAWAGAGRTSDLSAQVPICAGLARERDAGSRGAEKALSVFELTGGRFRTRHRGKVTVVQQFSPTGGSRTTKDHRPITTMTLDASLLTCVLRATSIDVT